MNLAETIENDYNVIQEIRNLLWVISSKQFERRRLARRLKTSNRTEQFKKQDIIIPLAESEMEYRALKRDLLLLMYELDVVQDYETGTKTYRNPDFLDGVQIEFSKIEKKERFDLWNE